MSDRKQISASKIQDQK